MATDKLSRMTALDSWHHRASVMFAEIGKIAGFTPPSEMTSGFESLQKELLESVPLALSHLSPSRENGPDWLARFRHAVLTSVQEGLYASLYHLTRAEQMETEILQTAVRHAPALAMPVGSAAGGGNSRALNFEYQAFAFATRRTLEYAGVATAAYFKAECHSIRHLASSVRGREPKEVSERLTLFLEETMPTFQDIIPEDKHNDRSLRDRLAHWESISAGSFGISRSVKGYDIGIVGGGYEFPPFRGLTGVGDATSNGDVISSAALGPALRDEFARVEVFVYGLLRILGLKTPG